MNYYWIKYFIIAFLFFIFSLIQASFFPYFNIWGATPNLVFILFSLLIFFDAKEQGFFYAIFAGLLSDIFLLSYFGVAIISFLIIYSIQRLTVYFIKNKSQYAVFYFMIIFSVNFILYNILIYLFSIIFNFPFNFGWIIIVSLLYNLIIALPGFYVYKMLTKTDYTENQLKLL